MLDRFRQIHLLNILGIVWIQLILDKRTCFVEALFAPKSNDRDPLLMHYAAAIHAVLTPRF
jgi:hypothetical protein